MKRPDPAAAASGFFWQGVLILLPVLLLATAGLWSIRQDRILARHDAIERAQAAANQIADAWWGRLFDRAGLERFKEHTFRIDGNGQLLFPPPAPVLPTPRAPDLKQLNDTQRYLWKVATGFSSAKPQWRAVISVCRDFLASKPPAEFAARAQFQLAQGLAEDGRLAEAADRFRAVADQFPDCTGDSGLPLAPLAQFKALELRARAHHGISPADAAAITQLCSNLVFHPTFLTPTLLRRLAELPGLADAPDSGEAMTMTNGSARTSTAQTNPVRVWDVATGKLISTSAVDVAADAAVPAGEPAKMPAPWGRTNLVDGWLEQWESHQSLRALAAAALEQAPLRKPSSETLLATNLLPPLPVLPALFWLHSAESVPASELFPPAESRLIRELPTSTRNAMLPIPISGPGAPPLLEPASTPPSSLSGSRFPAPVSWIAARLGNPDGTYSIVCRPMGGWSESRAMPMLGSVALQDLRQNLPALPPWLGYSLDMAGVTIVSSNNLDLILQGTHGAKGGEVWKKAAPAFPPEILAGAARFENGVEYLRVNVHFLSPAMFYIHQQTRSRLFGALVLLSVAAALIGFASARRAFLRQQQLSELKSNFVSSVSHELRAPIASMRLLAESLQRGKIVDPARQGDYFRFLVQECRRLSSLVENVLNFARIEQGRKQYELEPTDVASLLRQTFQLMEPAALEKQVALGLDLPESELARLTAPPLLDGQAMQQALINLIDNALKHSAAGQTVTLGLHITPAGGEAATEAATEIATAAPAPPQGLQLFVQDHGPGIPPQDHERIFDRFYRRGSELRRETQGVGIGLSIVKHIAEAHRGRVIVQSDVGCGSRFIIELPLASTATS